MKIKAYAKVNLMLDILGTLPNSYHNLWMIMQSVSLYDTVTVTKNDSGKITITCDKEGIPTDEKKEFTEQDIIDYLKEAIKIDSDKVLKTPEASDE